MSILAMPLSPAVSRFLLSGAERLPTLDSYHWSGNKSMTSEALEFSSYEDGAGEEFHTVSYSLDSLSHFGSSAATTEHQSFGPEHEYNYGDRHHTQGVGGIDGVTGLVRPGLGGDNSVHHTHWEDFPSTPDHLSVSWVAILLMCFVLIATVVGNLLVCISVILVRKLRKPQNYLLVSLALSDLFVAVFVMPFAIVVELYQGQWPLNNSFCDLWVSADVLCCTASILNLCGISVDRYQAITAPFDYSARSTPRRMLGIIFVVWLGSACVSLPPVLLLGNEYQAPNGEAACSVSQNFWYQIYATMASFYIPLCVMLVVYLKILRVVTDKKKEMNWKKKNSSLPVHFQANSSNLRGGVGESGARTSIPNLSRQSSSSPPSNAAISPRTPSSPFPPSWASPGQLIPMKPVHQSQSLNQQHLPQQPQQSIVVTTKLSGSSSSTSSATVKLTSRNSIPNYRSTDQEAREQFHETNRPAHESRTCPRSVRQSLSIPCVRSTAKGLKTKKLLSGLKEHKASTTLGIIMSAFIVCWLPFFVLALARPILNVEIPDWISSLFNWLGYANSALNPIIYATLNRDFRRPFREILSFRCATLNTLMRKEFYLEQYGEDTDNIRNKASVTLIFLENGNIAEPLL